jgi:hypothetical protein
MKRKLRDLSQEDLGRGHTKETGNRNVADFKPATGVSLAQ